MNKYSQTEHPNPPDCGTETAEEENERIKAEDEEKDKAKAEEMAELEDATECKGSIVK